MQRDSKAVVMEQGPGRTPGGQGGVGALGEVVGAEGSRVLAEAPPEGPSDRDLHLPWHSLMCTVDLPRAGAGDKMAVSGF